MSCLLCLLALGARGQTVDPPNSEQLPAAEPEAELVGPHHRQWILRDAEGQVTSQYLQLQTGLMRQLEDGSWIETSTEIELFNDGAIARKTRHQVIFSPGSEDPAGVFDVLTPDGKRLRGSCLGIAYAERSTGRSVFIAEAKAVAGEVVGLNEVVYRNCFDGEVSADLVYRVTSAGLIQDVVFRSNIPPPSDYNFGNDVDLEIWTQFFEAPEAEKRTYQRLTKSGNQATDCIVNFGVMRIGQGKAFPVHHGEGLEGPNLAAQAPVHKAYEQIEGAQFLIESVPYADAIESIANLPAPLEARNIDKGRLEKALAGIRDHGKAIRSKPASYIAKTEQKRSDLRIAKASKSDRLLAGYVLDYDLSDGTQTDFTFKADTTYYVSGTVYLNATTIIEGGTVIKFANTNTPQLIINVDGALNMKTEAYNPAIFCAKDDNSVGVPIGSGSPSGLYAQTAIGYWENSPVTIKHVQIRNADFAIYIGNNLGQMANTLSDAQIINCGKVIVNGSSLYLRNVLFYNCTKAFQTANADLHCENVTFNQVQNFGALNVATTNSIFCNVGSLSVSGAFNITNNTESAIFQTVGGGKHYLLSDSFRNTGTTNINATLRSELMQRTTYPPIVLSNVTVASNSQFYPVVQRDTDIPDAGYHYYPIDWAMTGVLFTNSQVSIAPGAAIATFRASSTYGLKLMGTATLDSSGTASQPVRIAHATCVQEQANTNWAVNFRNSISLEPATQLQCRFTDFFSLANPASNHYDDHFYGYDNQVNLSHCRFSPGSLSLYYFGYAGRPRLNPINCHFNRVVLNLFSVTNSVFQNCTFRGGLLELYQPINSTVVNCLFERTILDTNATVTHSFNAYESGYNRLLPTNTNDVVLSNPITYASNTFGQYYQAVTNLVNRGSASASSLGLYHFTLQSSEAKETNGTVDIGFHYAAAPASVGLVGYWRFDEAAGISARDLSAYGHHGSLVNGASWASGQAGSSVSLDGSNDYVQVGAPPELIMSTALTMTAWIYPTPGAGIIVNKEGEYEVAIMDGAIQWALANSYPGWTWIHTSYSPPTNQWTHVAITYDGSYVRTYANGSQVHIQSASGTLGDMDAPNDDFRIGGRQSFLQYFNGRIDEVRMYNRALSAAEIPAVFSFSTFDSDSDGTPDYLEDADGDGSLDSGETNPSSATDAGLGVFITEPKANSNIP